MTRRSVPIYGADLQRRPNYDDGKPRPTWETLGNGTAQALETLCAQAGRRCRPTGKTKPTTSLTEPRLLGGASQSTRIGIKANPVHRLSLVKRGG